MAKQTITLHMYENTELWRAGERGVLPFDFRGTGSENGRIWIGQQDVEVDFPEIDTRQLQIDALEEQIKREKIDSETKVNLLLDRISKLRAIAHEVVE